MTSGGLRGASTIAVELLFAQAMVFIYWMMAWEWSLVSVWDVDASEVFIGIIFNGDFSCISSMTILLFIIQWYMIKYSMPLLIFIYVFSTIINSMASSIVLLNVNSYY